MSNHALLPPGWAIAIVALRADFVRISKEHDFLA